MNFGNKVNIMTPKFITKLGLSIKSIVISMQ